MILVSGLDIGKAHGGAERFGIELARHLNPDRYSVLLCAFWRRHTHSESHWVDQLNNSGVRITFASDWPGRFTPRAYFRGVLKLLRELESEPLDILHSHYQMGTLASLHLRSRKRTRIAIRTAHGAKEWGFDLSSWVARSILTDWVYPLTLDAEAGVSQDIVNAISRHPGSILGRKTPLLIHNAIYPESFQAEPTIVPNPDENLLKDQNIVGSVGRFTLQKGFHYLLKAIPIVNFEVPNTRYILVGDGDYGNR
jgi:glycosyltransferase involved in cell wall biosynthesis